MFGNRGSRIASWMIKFMPTSRWHGLKRFLLRKIGGIEIGEDTTIWSGVIFSGRYIKVGKCCHFGEHCKIIAPSPEAWITIGDWCSFGPEVYVCTGGHDQALGPDHRENGVHRPITIGERVGLGLRSSVMCDITIGDHVIVTPGICVMQNIPSNTLVGPAKLRMLPFN